MANTQMQVALTPAARMATAEDLPRPPPPALEDLPLPPPKETFSKFHQQRQANELRRLYRHIHPELRKNLEEAVAEDLAEVLDSEEPTEGDVQCMRWIFENWRLDAIGDHEKPAVKEPIPSGDVQGTSRKFEEGSFANSTEQEPAGSPPSRGDVRAARWLFETKPLDALTGQAEAPEAPAREPAASGDVQGTRMLFETRPLDRLGSRPSIQEQSPLELRSEIQELKGDVKKTVKLFQTEPLCAIQDADGAIHEVKAACREEIQSNAVRSARWLFETQPLDAINRDPSQVRVIRGISLEEAARPDVSATRWIFETQPLDAIREILVDEKDFQPSPDLIPPGPDVQRQRHLFETQALDTLKGEEAEAEAPPKEEVVPGDVRSTLWLFEMKPLDAPRDKVQVGHLQRVGPQEGEGLMSEHLSSDSSSALSLSQTAPQRDEVKGDVKTFKNLFETIPLDSIGQGETSAPRSASGADGADSAGQSRDTGSPVYAMQDAKGHLHALTSVSREQVVGGDVQGYRWMFETQPLDQLGRSPSTVDVVRGITRQEVVAGDVGTARWLFETQPLEVIHQRERQERQEEEGRQAGPQPEAPLKGDVQTVRWLFETCPMSELAGRQGSEVTDPTAKAEERSCTWMFVSQPLDRPEGSREQHLQVSQVQAGERQTNSHVFETEALPASGRPGGRGPVRYCSRVEIPSGQVSRQKEVFQALEAGKKEDQGSRAIPEPIPAGSVHKFTWLFENCPMGSLAAESIRGGDLQEEQPAGPSGSRVPERQETAAQGTLRTLYATPGILHRGGILMEARGGGELCLAKYMLPGPGQGGPCIRKEELVSGELPRIVRQVLRRPDVDQQGLLVQEDPAGRLQLKPLKLPAPGSSSSNVEDLDPEFQQLLACSLGTSVARTGLVMQETEQGLVSLTAYSLQPWLTSRAPERSSVQLLASCIDKGDLSGLHSLRWEPPADPSPVPTSEGAQRLPPTENIIHIPPLDPSMGIGHLRGPRVTPCSPQAIGMTVPLTGKEKQEDSCTEQKGMVAVTKSEGAVTTPPGPGAPDLQAAMQGLRMAAAEAQSLHQQVLSKHKPGPPHGTISTPVQDGFPQAPAAATGSAQSDARPVAGGDPRIPAAPRKVSGEQKAPPAGLPGGWGTIQDGIYTAHPKRTSDLCGGVQPSEREPLPRDRETALSAQAPGPRQEGPGQSLGPGREEPGGCTRKAWGPPGKATAGVGPGGLQAAETTLKAAPLAHHTLPSGPWAASASLHSHNASVPPPPPLPAAVTGPDFPAQAHRDEDSIWQASAALKGSLPHSHPSPAGQRTPGESQTKTPKLEPTMSPRKKPQLPPKPAYLSQLPPPQRLPKPSARPPSSSQGECKQSEPDAAIPRLAKVPTTASQGHESLAGHPNGQNQPSPQHGPSTVASRPTKSQAVGCGSQSPEPRKFSALSSDPTSLQQSPSPLGEKLTESSQQEASQSPKILQGSQQELQSLLNEVQALEKEAASSVDVRALRRLFEAVPELGGAPQPPADPCKPEASVEQAFGELRRVSTEVARLKEQTLARLLDIEEAVHKALSSMSNLQSEANTRSHSQGPPKDHSASKISVITSSRARPNCSGQEVKGQTAVKSQTEATCHPEVQNQAEVRNHTEATGQAVSTIPSTRRLETLREDSGLPRILPSTRDSPSSSTCISIQSATRKLPKAPSPEGSPDARESTHLAQDVSQAPLHQKGVLDKAGKQEVAQCSGQPTPAPASASPLPSMQVKSILELQTGLGGSQHYGAMRTEQDEGAAESRSTVLASSTTVMGQAGSPRGPDPHLGLQASSLLRQFLHSPAGLSGDLAEAQRVPVPCGHSQPAAQ